MPELNDIGRSATANICGGTIDCIMLTCFDAEFRLWAALLRYAGVRMLRAETLEEADFLMTVAGATVLLVDVAFLDGTW